MKLDARERGYAAALASVLIWAMVPVGTRYFVLRVDPYVFNLVRFAASAAAAAPLFVYAKPWRWPRTDLALLALCALLAVPGYNIPVALGARGVPAGELGVLIATEPVMIAALSLMLQRRRLHARVITGSVLALGGVSLTAGIWSANEHADLGSTLEVLFGAFCWSCYTVLAVPLNRRYGSMAVTGAIVVVGGAALVAFSLPSMGDVALPDRLTVLELGAMGLASSLLGFLLWNYAGALVPAERLGLFLYLLPLVSLAGGVRFLAESLTLQILLGGVLTIFGVWVASRSGRVPAPALIE